MCPHHLLVEAQNRCNVPTAVAVHWGQTTPAPMRPRGTNPQTRRLEMQSTISSTDTLRSTSSCDQYLWRQKMQVLGSLAHKEGSTKHRCRSWVPWHTRKAAQSTDAGPGFLGTQGRQHKAQMQVLGSLAHKEGSTKHRCRAKAVAGGSAVTSPCSGNMYLRPSCTSWCARHTQFQPINVVELHAPTAAGRGAEEQRGSKRVEWKVTGYQGHREDSEGDSITGPQGVICQQITVNRLLSLSCRGTLAVAQGGRRGRCIPLTSLWPQTAIPHRGGLTAQVSISSGSLHIRSAEGAERRAQLCLLPATTCYYLLLPATICS